MGGQKRMSLSLYTLVKKEWAYTLGGECAQLPNVVYIYHSYPKINANCFIIET
jgi:hypothetical protein